MANLFEFLPGEGAAVEFIKSAIEKGKSLLETANVLETASVKIRPALLEQVYNYFSGPVAAARSYLNHVTLNAIPSIERLPLSTTTQLRNFAYRVRIDSIDLNTGDTITTGVTVSSNELLSKQQALDIASQYAETYSGETSIQDQNLTVTDIFVNSAGLVPDPRFFSFSPEGISAGLQKAALFKNPPGK